MKWYTIGSLTIPASWLAIVGACIFTVAGLYFCKKRLTAEWYGNAIFVWLLTWKLSVLLFQFPMIWAHPLSVLYFHGGVKGYWLGFIVAILYTLYKVRRQHLQVVNLYQAWISSMILYEVFQAILNQMSFLWAVIQILSGGFFLLFVSKKNQLLWKEQLLILYTAVQAVFYSLHHSLLSVPMVTYFLMAIILVIALRKWEVSA